MKVSDYMQKTVVTISPSDPALLAIKTIFNLGFNSVPVVFKKKIVGIITDDDILKKLFPSISDYMQDVFSGQNFNAMETNMHHLMKTPVSEIMTKDVILATADTPIMRAQSLMLLHGFTHLPVVDNKKNLVGIIAQGDIFKALVESEIPYDNSDEYFQWLAHHYDVVVPWETRLDYEIPSLIQLFKKNNIRWIIDVFCGTGEHAIALAKKGYQVSGLNEGTLMHHKAVEKYNKQPKNIQDKLRFKHGSYSNLLEKKPEPIGAVVFLGNALGHLTADYEKVLKIASKKMQPKSGLLVLQITNIDKILNQTNRLQDFTVVPSAIANGSEYAFLQFYDPPRQGEKFASLTMSIMLYRLRRWHQKAINSTSIVYLNAEIIKTLLKKSGFSKIEIYGSNYEQPLFNKKFDPKLHDWMNVVAYK